MSSFDYQKFANTVLYILERTKHDEPGVTALLKMLWFADSWHYRDHLKTITGAKYLALPNGPVVDNYRDLLDRLVAEKLVERRPVKVYGQPKPKQHYRAKVTANEALFTPSEREVLACVITECEGQTGASLSERTHREGAWSLVFSAAEPNREIPRTAIRWLDNMPTADELEGARKLLARRALASEIAALTKSAVSKPSVTARHASRSQPNRSTRQRVPATASKPS